MMNVWTKITDAVAAFRREDYLCALKCINDAVGMVLDIIHPDHPIPVGAGPESYATIEECATALEAKCEEAKAVQAAGSGWWVALLPVMLDFAQKLYEAWKNRNRD